MTSEDRHVARRGGPHGDTCTRCGEHVGADIHLVEPVLHNAPTWLVTVRAPQGGPVYTHTYEGGSVNALLQIATFVSGLDIDDADAVLITATRPDKDVLPLPDSAIDTLLEALERTGLSAAPSIVRKFGDGHREIFEAGLRKAAREVLMAVLR